ncbi:MULTISPECIES: flagellar biosynthetic protein FliO [unclassified Rhizobium]|uniref:flagellar biosynthetic protein FliO n=1 Tax=unclassified Rhizobium TaxID=2613769 RepID=UPI000EA9240B|nr:MULTISPECIES: flagellar biosynthetic protein FliO [unclassified Rhizobium]AYG66428.1 flagellar biosynthesis protein FliO [Rhizobium sp. CCGE531]AYG72809.1 flagellar biosynthesis protein FliO [Rhizobium sp. CCGE532]
MLDDIAGAYGSRFFLAAGGVGVALIVLIGILWILRNRAPSPFVRGGKNRQPRLQVLDAAAVDARRRLVLVRRDGIEHLIMIGGPTDIVIESGISDPARAGVAATPVEIPPAYESRQQQPEKAAELDTPPAALPQRLQSTGDRIEAYLRSETPAAPALELAPTPHVAAERPQPAPVRPPQPAPQTASAISEAEAADILDAARHVVLPQQQSAPIRPAPVEPVVAPPRATEPGNDFQRILEAEMSKNLTDERIIPHAPTPRQVQQQPTPSPAPSPAQRIEPELVPLTGADNALQQEVARIFGEMSVSRDK